MYDPQVYGKFLEFRDDLFEEFHAQQQNAVGEVFTRIESHIEHDLIKFAVDLGCGTGEVLRCLRDTISRKLPGKTVRYYGLDICAAEINRARAFSHDERGNVVCEYRCHEAETIANAALPVDWACTLLMCVGHTLPHFLRWSKFRESILRLKPKYLLIDFFHSWDTVVERLQRDPTLVIREPRHVTPDRLVYSLCTSVDDSQVSDCGRAVLKRGIEKQSDGEILSTGFWTYQHHCTSGWFLREVVECGYIPHTEILYQSGYGPMKAVLLVSIE